MLSHFDRIPECDGQTDRFAISIRMSVATCGMFSNSNSDWSGCGCPPGPSKKQWIHSLINICHQPPNQAKRLGLLSGRYDCNNTTTKYNNSAIQQSITAVVRMPLVYLSAAIIYTHNLLLHSLKADTHFTVPPIAVLVYCSSYCDKYKWPWWDAIVCFNALQSSVE